MKVHLPVRTLFRFAAVLIVSATFPAASHSQTFFGEASNPADNGSLTTTTAAVTPPTGMQAGDLVIIYAHTRGTNTPSITTANSGGQTWNTVATGNNSGTTQRTTLFWCEFTGTWGANPVVSGGSSGNPLTAVMYVFRPTDPANYWDVHIAAANANVTAATVSITGVTTTVPNTVTMAFWASPDDNTWNTLTGTGWSKTGVNQYRNTGGNDQSHTAAYNIQASPATIPNVSQTESGSEANRTTIITWYEFPPPTAPSNDECAGAITLPVSGSCSNVPGTVIGATASTPTNLGGPSSSCGGGNAGYDVWYKFTAVNTGTTTITLSSLGANFTNRRMEAYSGDCGTLTYVNCSTNNTNTLTVTTTAGTTYYIRVASTGASSPITDGTFNICATTSGTVPLRFGNSYVNVSKKTSGGTVEPGDTLEIRMTINHTTGTVYYPRYVDNIPTNTTMLTGANDSIRIITNEGLTSRRYTLAAGDDAATYNPAPPTGEFNIRLNLGFGTTNPGIPADNTATSVNGSGTMIANTHTPKGGGGMLFATAYRVVVSGALGDTITIHPGQFLYKTTNSTGAADVVLTATPFKIIISEPLDLCANSIGVSIAAEDNGTFGDGSSLNRGTDLASPISSYTFVNDVNATNTVGDGRYGIVKNISPRSGTNRNARKRPDCDVPAALPTNDPLNCNNRMFGGHWDIDGDHTGTNDAIGNTPPDITEDGGYMLLVNADYVASEVYQQTITSLCPNTYYEFSAWIRNVCSNCGIDSLGRQFNSAMDPALVDGYPGVNPNLTFALNGVDIYSSGEIEYGNGWVKKGFVFKTAVDPGNYTLSIRNNSQGGGGNDWAMDDIAVATCFPTMAYSPSVDPQVCSGNALAISDTVRSFYDNYTEYKWQRLPVGSGTWQDIAGTQGSAVSSTQLINGYYTFISTYAIPPVLTDLANDGDQYRLVVASNPDNLLFPECSFSDPSSINVTVNNCEPVLYIDLLSFNGRLMNDFAVLNWITSKEDKPYTFTIEKSTDQLHFIPIGTVAGNNNPSLEKNYYSLTDPQRISGKVWYRLAMTDARGAKQYSRIISLNNSNSALDVSGITNPFSNKMYFEITSDQNTKVDVALIDMLGNVVKRKTYSVFTGTNSLSLEDTGNLASGLYALRLEGNGKIITQKVVKRD